MNEPFEYPKHFKLPEGERNFFADNIAPWNQLVSNLIENKNPNDPRVAIEIGSLYGGCSVWMLETFISRPQDFLHCVDINESEYLKNNLLPYKNVKLHLGLSGNVLTELWHTHQKPTADLVYVDGSHIAKHVIEDAVLSWKLLKTGGVLVFDDYGWGSNGTIDDQPKTGIDAFLHGYQGHYELLGKGWQVYLQKIKYEIKDCQLGGNYAINNTFFNRENL